MSLSTCESWEQVSCDTALLASDVVEIVEHDNGVMLDDVEFDDVVDVELCDGEKDCHYFVLSPSVFFSFLMLLIVHFF